MLSVPEAAVASLLDSASQYSERIEQWKPEFERLYGKTDIDSPLYDQRMGYLPLAWFVLEGAFHQTHFADHCAKGTYPGDNAASFAHARLEVVELANRPTRHIATLDQHGLVYGHLKSLDQYGYIHAQHWNPQLKTQAKVLVGICVPIDGQMVMPAGYASINAQGWKAWTTHLEGQEFTPEICKSTLRYAISLERYKSSDYKSIIEKIKSIDTDRINAKTQ